MQELSMNIQDITQNSISAGASNINITIDCDKDIDLLTITIEDDGCGMDEDKVAKVIDPFFTTRTTRDVGLGVPFFKMAAEMTGGSFTIESEKGVGTKVVAVFVYSNIDRPPLGALDETISQLMCLNENIEIKYNYKVDGKEFTVSTGEFTSVLEGVPLNTPQVMLFVRGYLSENMINLD